MSIFRSCFGGLTNGCLLCMYCIWITVLFIYIIILILLLSVVKYRKGDEDSIIDKIYKLNIHSIIKKSNRVSSHLKHLTGFAPQVNHSPHNLYTWMLFGLQVSGSSAWSLHPLFLDQIWRILKLPCTVHLQSLNNCLKTAIQYIRRQFSSYLQSLSRFYFVGLTTGCRIRIGR